MLGIFKRSLIVRITSCLGIALIIILALITIINIRYQNRVLMDREYASSRRLADSILIAMHYPMTVGRQEAIQEQFEKYKELKEIEVVHLLDHNGIIKRSTDPNLLGEKSRTKYLQEALKGHAYRGVELRERTRTRVYSDLRPILNEQACFGCHSPEQEVLGVLRLAADWDPVDEALAGARNWNILISALSLALISSIIFIFLLRIVIRPIEALVIGTTSIAKGDLSYQIATRSRDEIGELTSSFNKMAKDLKKGRNELQQWSKTLEQKVSERTAQLEAAHKQLLEQEKMAAMGRMALVISHELKNIFAGIQTCSYYLKIKTLEKFPELVKFCRDIEDAVDHANNILSDILNFSRAVKLTLGDTDINLVIKDMLSSLGPQKMFKDSKIEVIEDLDSNLPKIKADDMRIREIISNLVINAVQAMPDGGKLTVVTRRDGGFLRLEVIDTGCGITEAALGRLFTPFFTTKSRGLGLGLSICKDIVEAHKGRIEVKTELNKGSSFIVSLPLENITYGT